MTRTVSLTHSTANRARVVIAVSTGTGNLVGLFILAAAAAERWPATLPDVPFVTASAVVGSG